MYASPYFTNWLASQVAGQALTVGLYTGSPGNNGTANRATANNGTAGVTTTINANAMSATANRVDNDAEIEVFTPNSTSAGQTVTHLGYFFGSNFIGWTPLAAPVVTVDGQAFPIAEGTLGITFALAS